MEEPSARLGAREKLHDEQHQIAFSRVSELANIRVMDEEEEYPKIQIRLRDSQKRIFFGNRPSSELAVRVGDRRCSLY